MTRKYHNHILQTNPQHRKEEANNDNSHTPSLQREKVKQPAIPLR